MNITVRKALRQELAWINDRYDEAGFKRSHFEREIIAIAEMAGERVGLGRLVKINDQMAELSGVYVLPNYRQQGIASQIIKFLLEINPFQQVFCLPLAHQKAFYARYGFDIATPSGSLPAEIQEKYEGQKYEGQNRPSSQEILLLVLNR
jgi:N-acetylglutamate synthase-like GNAT family acetyltransferase